MKSDRGVCHCADHGAVPPPTFNVENSAGERIAYVCTACGGVREARCPECRKWADNLRVHTARAHAKAVRSWP